MICKECGAKLPPDQTVCPRCGALQPQAVRPPVQKRQKPVTRAAVSQQQSAQKPTQKQVVYTWRDKLILIGTVVLALCAVIWFVAVLAGTADYAKAKDHVTSVALQTTDIFSQEVE